MQPDNAAEPAPEGFDRALQEFTEYWQQLAASTDGDDLGPDGLPQSPLSLYPSWTSYVLEHKEADQFSESLIDRFGDISFSDFQRRVRTARNRLYRRGMNLTTAEKVPSFEKATGLVGQRYLANVSISASGSTYQAVPLTISSELPAVFNPYSAKGVLVFTWRTRAGLSKITRVETPIPFEITLHRHTGTDPRRVVVTRIAFPSAPCLKGPNRLSKDQQIDLAFTMAVPEPVDDTPTTLSVDWRCKRTGREAESGTFTLVMAHAKPVTFGVRPEKYFSLRHP